MISYCRICGIQIESKVKRSLCDCLECRKKAKAENDKRYRNSEKGKATRKKNRYSPKTIATRKAYEKTERYKKSKSERAKKYRKNPRVVELDKLRKLKYYYRKYSGIRYFTIEGKDKITLEEFRVLFSYDECYYCKKEVRGRNKTIDHKIPVSKGGTNDINNLVICCRSCNSEKNNKTEEEYKKWKQSR